MKHELGQEQAFPMDFSRDGFRMEYGMSKQLYAAIELRIPDSGEEWLDDMIRKANIRDASCVIMQGLLTNKDTLSLTSEQLAGVSRNYAYELLKATE